MIRLLEPGDEPAVRRICFDTAFRGESMAPLMADAYLVSEALIGVYLRFERDCFLVADLEGRVAGYLAGCPDTRGGERALRRMVPRLMRLAASRGHLWQPAAWFLALRGLESARRLAAARADLLDRYPAHLHVNLDPAHRGRGTGTALLRRFLGMLHARGVPGVHVSAETPSGKAFFAGAGFVKHADYPRAWRRGEPTARVDVMVRAVTAGDAPDGRSA